MILFVLFNLLTNNVTGLTKHREQELSLHKYGVGNIGQGLNSFPDALLTGTAPLCYTAPLCHTAPLYSSSTRIVSDLAPVI